MTRMVLSVFALVAVSIGQQQAPKPVAGSTVAGSTSVQPSGQEGTVRKARSKAPTLEMRLAAVCEKLMRVEWDFSQMEDSEIAKVEDQTEKCIPVLHGHFRDVAIIDLKMAVYIEGWKHGREAESKNNQDQISAVERASETEKETVINSYDALANRYNSLSRDYDKLVDRYNVLANDYNNRDAELVSRYNSLVNNYNSLLGLARQFVALPPLRSSFSLMPPSPPPPRELHLTCTASPLPGDMATVNCW
jgi:hypothetical protein